MSSKTNKMPVDAGVVAATMQAGEGWRCLIARLSPGRIAVLASREFPAGSSPQFQPWLDQHKVSRVLMVLPASAVICRTFPLPSAAPEQLESALRLQAESHLLGQVPVHRCAMAVLHEAPGETTRTGIVLAWPTSSHVPRPPVRADLPITFAPDIAALAALLDGNRPGEPILWADRRDGSLALAMTHANGAAFRATREDASTDSTWAANVRRVVAETAINVGHGSQFVETLIQSAGRTIGALPQSAAALSLPAEMMPQLATRVTGAGSDSRWWSTWGMVAGVLLAASDHLAPLTGLLDAAPVQTPSALQRLAARAGRPGVATRIAVLCLALLLLSPLVFSGLRLMILKAKVPDLTAFKASTQRAQAKLAVYRELHARVWPMSKVLSDLACSTPEGVDISSIAIDQDLRVSGRAKKSGGRSPTDNILLMSQQLQQYGIFEGVRHSWEPEGSTSYKFDLVAQIKDPYRIAQYPREQDFGQWTAFQRTYPSAASRPDSDVLLARNPEDESHVAPPEPPPTGDEAEGASPNGTDYSGPRLRPPTVTGGPRIGPEPSGIRGRVDAPLPPSVDIPAPLTQEQIDAMSRDEARDMWGRVARALSDGNINEETKKRLQEDFAKLRLHMRKVNAPTGS